MDTSRLEALLEQLIDKQDELIGRIEPLESTLEFQILNTNSNLDELTSVSRNIYEELNWWGEGHSLAKQLLIRLDTIELAVGSSH